MMLEMCVERLERLEKVAQWVAVVCATLGILTSGGCLHLPAAPRATLALLHPLLLAVGALAGWAVVVRGRDIDRRRWQIVEDDQVTSGERRWAHKDAERRRRWAGTWFVGAPLMLGYWLAYQVEGGGRLLAAQLLPVSALAGTVIGLVAGRLHGRRKEAGR